MRGFRGGLCAFGLSLVLPGIVGAAEVSFSCPAIDALPAIDLHFHGDALDVTDPTGTATLPASLEGDVSDMFGVSGFGPAEQMTPEPAEMDACLAARLKSVGSSADDKDMVAYVLAGCQSDLAGKTVKQSVDLHVTASVVDKGQATVFVQRTYPAASTVTGAPLTLDEWPTRDCTVTLP